MFCHIALPRQWIIKRKHRGLALSRFSRGAQVPVRGSVRSALTESVGE